MSLLTVVALAASMATPSIVPKPVEMKAEGPGFTINKETAIYVSGDSVVPAAEQLRDLLSPATGYPFPIIREKRPNTISLYNTKVPHGGYWLSVTPDVVSISSNGNRGLFYGFQTLRQLLPPDIYRQAKVEGVDWTVQGVYIDDYPRFEWRGLMMDVARHYMPKREVLRMIDLMAVHKMSVLHLHLTDDQGWRVEIKKYPKLTEVGSFRPQTVIGKNTGQFDGKPVSGFYTQDDLREIVAYAEDRYITVVPEIDMPGHMVAAITAYPELGDGRPAEVMQTWGVSNQVLNTKDSTVQFCKDVLDEIMAIFPSQFIHVGGDECPKTQWENDPAEQQRMKERGLKDEHELQSWFIRQMDAHLTSKGRRLIGWDEILEGGLAENATVMSWRGTEGGIAAANQGNDVVMSPTSHLYLDYYQGEPENEPFAIGGFVPLEKVYAFDPVPAELATDNHTHILGVQGNLWSEYIKDFRHMEYMAFPRGCAVAEIGWSPQSEREFGDFQQRMQLHYQRLERLDVNYRRPR